MSNKIINIEDLSFSYDSVPILENISFSVDENDFMGIIGPNGGGKTTLLKLILGLIEPGSGKIKVFDKSPAKARSQIGYVPQYSTMDKNFPISAFEVVAMGKFNNFSFLPFTNKNDKKEIFELMDHFKISSIANMQFGELSGGQKQRCLIARAIISNPKLLLLDEPTASVDSSVEQDIYELLSDLNKNMTILLVSHDLGFISSYINKVACVNKNIDMHLSKEISLENIDNLYHGNVSIIKHNCGL